MVNCWETRRFFSLSVGSGMSTTLWCKTTCLIIFGQSKLILIFLKILGWMGRKVVGHLKRVGEIDVIPKSEIKEDDRTQGTLKGSVYVLGEVTSLKV